MSKLELLQNLQRNELLKKRSGETKFGEQIKLLSNIKNIYDQLVNLDVKYVVFGIQEDVGIFANNGITGASETWNAVIKVLLNVQSNAFTHANKVCILGSLKFEEELNVLSTLNNSLKKDIEKARKLTAEIDKHVTQLVHDIVKAGKIPIIIGGGHNNAYGNIKGSALALSKPINAINFDAHTDFRALEGRHSGNGFSYANSEGFLNNYFIFGLHENYTSQAIFDNLNTSEKIAYNTFEAIEVRREFKYRKELKRAQSFVTNTNFGIEIDCDAIENISSSAMTPSGFSVTKTRQFLNHFGKHENATYLHICEAASKKKQASQIGKLIAYLITDFIRAHENRNN